MDDLLGLVCESWGWAGLRAAEVVGLNAFGNLLILDEDQAYWRICPEELSCDLIATSSQEFSSLVQTEDFQLDWDMTNLVKLAREHLGALPEGRVYCLVIPSVLGGGYDVENIRTAPLHEVVQVAGDLALQIKDLPEGAAVQLRVVD